MDSIELKFGIYITGHRQTNLIDFVKYCMHSFLFYRCTRKNFYALRPMESNSLKCSSIQMIRSIDLKFGMYIIVHRCTYCINFGELRINSFFFFFFFFTGKKVQIKHASCNSWNL